MTEFCFKVDENGLPPVAMHKALKQAYKDFAGKVIRWSIVERKEKRSSPQNAFYWGVAIPIIREAFLERGQVLSADDAHEIVVGAIWKHTKVIELMDGTQQEVRQSSSNLTTAQWEVYMDLTRAYFAPHGVIIPLPNERDYHE